MDALKKLYRRCKSSDEVIELYKRTKHNIGAFEYAKDKLLSLSEETDVNDDDNEPLSHDPGDWYSIHQVKSVHNKKFGLWGSDFELKVKPLNITGLNAALAAILRLFDHLFEHMTESAGKDDLIRIVFQSEELNKPVSLRTTRKQDLNSQMFFEACVSVLQSYEEFSLLSPMKINVTRIAALPNIGGRTRHEVNLSKHLRGKRSTISIRSDDDGLCVARSLVVGIAICNGLASRSNTRAWKTFTCHSKRLTPQYYQALDLHRLAGIPPGPVTLDLVQRFQDKLPQYQITVFSSDHENDTVFIGPERDKKINIIIHEGHCSVIRNMVPFVNKRKECPYCKKFLFGIKKTEHRCSALCYVCDRVNADCLLIQTEYCSQCNRVFRNKHCFDAHLTPDLKTQLSLCQSHFLCNLCEKHVSRNQIRIGFNDHICHEFYCRSCKGIVPPGHLCFIKQHTNPPKETSRFIFADFEADISSGSHIPVCVVATYSTGKYFEWYGSDTMTLFCNWLFNIRHANHIVFFHNLSGYDGNFLLQFLQQNRMKPSVIMKGLRIVQIHVKMLKLTIRDSLCHLPFRLADLPKAFGISELKKGKFPFLFVNPSTYHYVGEIPDEKYFFIESMSIAELSSFREWLSEQKGQQWTLKSEMLDYCRSDVAILRAVCLKYSENMRELTGFCPLTESTTLAGFVNLLYRAKFMPKDSIALLSETAFEMGRGASFESLEWFYYLSETQPNLRLQHARNTYRGEKKIGKFRVDGFDALTNTIYEYNGCYYHGCKKCMSPSARNISGSTMSELYLQTEKRKSCLIAMGYNYVEMWSCDWNEFKKTNTECQQVLLRMTQKPPLDPRESLRGGRCEAFQLIKIPEHNEHIAYKDCISMYPSILRSEKFPLGHPEIITSNFESIDQYFGLVYARILPPKDLLVPLLPSRINGKLFFTLCSTCSAMGNTADCFHGDRERELEGVYTTVELKKALHLGYKVEDIFEVWHYSSSSNMLFKDYIEKFMVQKIANSGFPSHCQTENEKQVYVASLADNGVNLRVEDIKDNPVMRLITKLLMNCLFGRFALRQNLPKFEYVNSVARFQTIMYSKQFEVDYLNIVDENTVQLQYHHKNDFEAADLFSNVVIASFCTSYGRTILFDAMTSISPERLLYCDTDGIFLVESDQYENTIPCGNNFGDFKDELDGDKIVMFFCAGPKTYAYLTAKGKEVFKAKGLTINSSNKDIFSLKAIEEMIRDPALTRIVCNPLKIFRTKGDWNIISRSQNKKFKFVFDKRKITESFSTIPHGYSI